MEEGLNKALLDAVAGLELDLWYVELRIKEDQKKARKIRRAIREIKKGLEKPR